AELGAVACLHRGDLRLQLSGSPPIIVVAERDEIGPRGQDAAVAGPAESRLPVIGADEDADAVRERSVGLGSVEDDDDLNIALVVLREHGLNRLPQLPGTISGRDNNADRRPLGHAARPRYP